MSSDGADKPETAKWDPGFTRQIKNWVGPVIKRYFRAEVRGLDVDARRPVARWWCRTTPAACSHPMC